MHSCLSVVLMFVISSLQSVRTIQVIDPRPLSNQVYDLIERASKRGEMQSYIDSIPQERKYVTNSDLNKIYKLVDDKFTLRTNAISNLKNAVIKAYTTGNTFIQAKDCCMSTEVKYDSRFAQNVNTNDICLLNYTNSVRNKKVDISHFLNAAKENLKLIPSLRWQYMVTTERLLVVYPAIKYPICQSRDISNYLIKSWYVQAVSPKLKRVIILMDTSGSMTQQLDGITKFDLTKMIVKQLIKTLVPQHEFTVITFASTADLLGFAEKSAPCFTNSFAPAVPRSKEDAYKLIDTLTPRGGSSYKRVFDRSFKFFRQYLSRNNDSSDECAIIMVSDGASNEGTLEQIYETFTLARDEGVPVQNFVITMVGVGPGEFPVMQDLALDNPYTNQSLVNIPMLLESYQLSKLPQQKIISLRRTGLFMTIEEESDVIARVGTFFEFFFNDSDENQNPYWTVPYTDNVNIGELVTISVPVSINNEFLGVIAIDLNTEVLFAPLAYFHPNKFSYSFVMDSRGLVAFHPLLFDNAALTDRYADARIIERDDEFLDVYNEMKRGIDGNTSFLATKILLENAHNLGRDSKAIKVYSTYIWKTLKNTRFSICFVLADEGSYLTFYRNFSLTSSTFLHHRIDLIRPKVPCFHLNQSAADETAVYFSPRSFTDPEDHLIQDYTTNHIRDIADYLERNGPNKLQLKPEARQDVVVTAEAAKLWNENIDANLQQYVLWKYVATKNGVMRIYPGIEFSKGYRPVTRNWYKSALAEPEKDVVTLPYIDSKFNISIITFCRAILQRSKEALQENDEFENNVYAVIAVDVILYYFYDIVHNLYGEWLAQRNYMLYLIDINGFVLLSNKYVNFEAKEVGHLTQIEPAISRKLINANILVHDNCTGRDGLLERRYILTLKNNYYSSAYSNGPGPCYEFSILPVPGTNFLILLRTLYAEVPCRREEQYNPCACNSRDCTTSWDDKDSCECPCREPNIFYNPCAHEFESESPYICTTSNTFGIRLAPKTTFNPKFPQCYNVLFEYSYDRKIHAIFLIIVLVIFFVSFITLSVLFNINLEQKIRNKQKMAEVKSIVEVQATTVGEYLAKMLQNDEHTAKEALHRVAALLHNIQHKPVSIETILANLPHQKYPPPKPIDDNVSSSIRFDRETSFIADSISAILREDELFQTVSSEVEISIVEQENRRLPRRPVLFISSTPEFQERSLDLLKSLMTVSLLSKPLLAQKKEKKSPINKFMLPTKKAKSPKNENPTLTTKRESSLAQLKTSLSVPKKSFQS